MKMANGESSVAKAGNQQPVHHQLSICIVKQVMLINGMAK
jgi:hypothetical protein